MGLHAETIRVLRFVPIAGSESEVAQNSLRKVVFTPDSIVLISALDGEPAPMYKYDYQAIVFDESSSAGGVEPTSKPSQNGWEKIIRNGQLYIRYKGTMYNVQGQRVNGDW